jgi:hypothetical protein
MPAPSLRIPVGADVSQFQKDMNKTSAIVSTATRAIAKQVIDMNAGFLASQGAVGGAALAFGRVLGVLGPIALGVTAIRDAFKLMGYATDLAKARIDEFARVAQEANASGFSTDFFQRITKSGGEAGQKIDDLTEALKKFNAESTPKLGGSTLQNRLDALTKAGNFGGNTGLAALASSTDSEGRLRATVSLIDQAMQKGERLAALDIAGTVFGPSVQKALQADSSYLDDMLKRADALSKAQIVSQEDVGRALELKERMEQAQKILADKWKPVQDDLASLGMNYHASWVSITEDLAAAVGYATQLYQALKQVPDWFANRIGGASIWTSLTNATGALGLNSTPESMGLIDDHGEMAANAKLAAALQNYANVTRGMQQATDIQSAVRGDTSKNPDNRNDQSDANAFTHTTEAIEKHTSRLQADTAAVGLGASALEEYRAKSALLTAAQQAGIPVTQATIDKITELAQKAGQAGDALARARVNSSIGFGRSTTLLSQEDVAIAQQLRGIYGDDVPRALASSEAAALRFNGAMRDVASSLQNSVVSGLADIFDGTKNASQGFADLAKTAARAIEEMIIKMTIVAPLMRALQGAFGGGLFGFADGGAVGSINVGSQSFPKFASGGLIAGTGGPRSDNILARLSPGEFVMNAAATARYRPMIEAMNQMRLPGFAGGGMVQYPGGESAGRECMGLPT